MSKKPISHRIGNRLKGALQTSEEFHRTYETLAPLLGVNITNLKSLLDNIERLSKAGRSLLADLEAIYGHALEGRTLAGEHQNDLAQITTVMANLDVFFEGDAEFVSHILSLADEDVLDHAIRQLPPDKIAGLEKSMQQLGKEA
jgi:ABC-type transporter Mla subunit MlaD